MMVIEHQIEYVDTSCQQPNADVGSKAQQSIALWRLRTVKAVTGLGRSTIYELVSKGNFPKQITYHGCAGWISSEVEAWVDQQIAKNRAISPEKR